MDNWKIFTNGILRENPVLVLIIGLCPVLATGSSMNDGFGMGVATAFVLISSNLLISMLRKFIPDSIRLPVFIIIISTFVTIVDYVMHAYMVELYASLGIFIPLIVVNCIILGRAEAFAYKNTVKSSLIDGIGMGAGFILAITLLGAIRELIGNGTLTFFGRELFNLSASINFQPVLVFIMPPGAFIVIGFMIAGVRWMLKKRK
ncbi:MAG: electron transport complex subunit RsxE [Nitrospinae bacterium RIFCSPLOWO2_02_39_17]|nr:MAG: electron transport complex subunit RsxE [Nitrospinae bacterium RIFCSPLOWO2_02_39_17]OGW10414.1 MAG: electron transport complex subunit RsxE [Nitrospinae bacterium RIFCSPLOWO2_12_39_15]